MRETAVLVAGGGISGLVTAFELERRGVEFVLVERASRLGGLIGTETDHGFIMDPGPDAFLTQKPEALALCDELGLSSRVIATNPQERNVYVLLRGELVPLPAGMRLTVPTLAGPLLRSRLFSPLGKLRLLAERFVPPRRGIEEESIAGFIRRRFGAEALERVGEPLLAGIHCGDAEHLSMDALFPRLVELEARAGSLSRAMGSGPQAASAFASLDSGMGTLIDALSDRLPTERVILGEPIEACEHASNGFVTKLAGGESIRSSSLVLALPLRVTEALTADPFPRVSALVAGIETASTVVLFHAFDQGAVSHPLDGYGFVVPESEPNRLLAATFVSTKFPGRAPTGKALLRTFLGGRRDPEAHTLEDDALIELSILELSRAIGLEAPPLFSRVRRWVERTPQVVMGHRHRIEQLRNACGDFPGLHLLGNGLGSVGIPDCIAEAKRAAGRISGGSRDAVGSR